MIPKTEDLRPTLDVQGRLMADEASAINGLLPFHQWHQSQRHGGHQTPCWACGNALQPRTLDAAERIVLCRNCATVVEPPYHRTAVMSPEFQATEIVQQIATGLLTPGPVIVAVMPPEGCVVVPKEER